MINLESIISVLIPLVTAPLLLGIINRVKATIAGREGQPILQPYYDIWKLLRKSAVYSKTTSWIFRLGSLISLAAIILGLTLIPAGPIPALIGFKGDIFLLVYLIGLARFMTVISALDTGSSFEGMGSSREVFFSALSEPAILLALLALAKIGDAYSLSAIFANISAETWFYKGASLALIIGALFVILLSENSRIPVDDPNTHLELTMIHEVMVLDHSGPDFAAITYGSALKLWINSALIVPVLLPIHTNNLLNDVLLWVCGMFLIAMVIGLIESSMARLRLTIVPQFLVGATVLAATAIILIYI